MPMSSHQTIGHTDTWSTQLSLHFPSPSPLVSKSRVADHIHAITSGKVTFHADESEIGENSFALKISYMGRSYKITGVYKKEQVRSFDQADFSATTIRILRFDSVLAFRDGRYVSAFLPKREYDEITGNTQNILSSSLYNRTIH